MTTCRFDTYLTGRVESPLLRFAGTPGPPPIAVHGTPAFVGDKRLPVVDVGTGTTAEFAAVRSRRTIAVARGRDDAPTAIVQAAQRAGAALVVLANDTDGLWRAGLEQEAPVPAVTVTRVTGTALIAARSVQVEGRICGRPAYDVAYPSPGGFGVSNRHALTAADVGRMAKVSTAVAALPGATGTVFHQLGRAPVLDGFGGAPAVQLETGSGVRRTEYVTARFPSAGRSAGDLFASLQGAPRDEAAGKARTGTWFGAPWRPLTRTVSAYGEFEAAVRDAAGIYLGLPPLADSDGHVEQSMSFLGAESTYTLRRTGKVVATGSGPFAALPLASGVANLELRYDVDAGEQLPPQGRSSTVWEFRSPDPGTDAQPVHLLEPDLILPVDLAGKLTGTSATVTVRRPFGAAVSLRSPDVAISTDNGQTWCDARTTFSGASGTATLPNITGAAPVAVRVKATDANGEAVSQTLFSAAVPGR